MNVAIPKGCAKAKVDNKPLLSSRSGNFAKKKIQFYLHRCFKLTIFALQRKPNLAWKFKENHGSKVLPYLFLSSPNSRKCKMQFLAIGRYLLADILDRFANKGCNNIPKTFEYF